MKHSVRELLRGDSGNVVIIAAVAFAVLLGFVALAVDTGVLYLEHARLARAADASALAGAQELPDTVKAQAAVVDYLGKNNINTTDPQNYKVYFSPDNKQVTVELKKGVNLYFAKFLGFSSSSVGGKAAARIAPVAKTTGLIPVGIDESLLPLAAGHEYVIKVGSPSVGWTGVIAYPGQSGADDYRQAARFGYTNTVAVGDHEDKASGNVSGPTIQGLQERITAASGDTWDNYRPDSPRVVLVPIYRSLGALPSDKVRIVGFASVFVEGVTGNGNESDIHVRYVDRTVSGETDDTLTNTYLNSVKLVE